MTAPIQAMNNEPIKATLAPQQAQNQVNWRGRTIKNLLKTADVLLVLSNVILVVCGGLIFTLLGLTFANLGKDDNLLTSKALLSRAGGVAAAFFSLFQSRLILIAYLKQDRRAHELAMRS